MRSSGSVASEVKVIVWPTSGAAGEWWKSALGLRFPIVTFSVCVAVRLSSSVTVMLHRVDARNGVGVLDDGAVSGLAVAEVPLLADDVAVVSSMWR